MSACTWGVQVADEVKGTLTGVLVGYDTLKIRDDLRVFINASWGIGACDGCWVEEGKCRFTIVRKVPEDEWGRKGLEWLKECNSGIV